VASLSATVGRSKDFADGLADRFGEDQVFIDVDAIGHSQLSACVNASWILAIAHHGRLLPARQWHAHETRWVIA
jgi:hypothetical protein